MRDARDKSAWAFELSVIAVDERHGAAARLVIGKLQWRGFHEVAGRPHKRAADAAIHCKFGAAHRIDHDTRGIRRVPHLKLHLGTQRNAAERCAFEPDVGALAVLKPRHMIARPDMNVSWRQRDIQLTGDGLRLGNLLRGQPLAFQHVLEIGIAAEIELISPVEAYATLAEQIGEHAMNNGRTDLALDVVANDRKPRLLK